MALTPGFNDGSGTQSPPKTPAGTPIETSLIPERRGASTRAMHTDGTLFTSWGAGIGFDLNFDGTTYRLYDATRYTGISFWARGQPGEGLTFRVSTESTTAAIYGGTCVPNCGGPTGVSLLLGPNWVQYVVPFTEPSLVTDGVTSQLDRLTNVQFKTRTYPFDFWVDDVSFLESTPDCCPSLPNCAGGVHFKDSVLASAILGSDDPSGVLDCNRVCTLRSVSAMGLGVRDLDGLECLTGLTTLSLANNQIEDLTPLSQLPGLVVLDIHENRVSNALPLQSLTNLASLNLADNQLARAIGLEGLVSLNTLDLSDNQLSELSSLRGLVGLQSLSVSNNQIVQVSDLGELVHLQTLSLSNNQIQSVAALSALAELTQLDLSHNQLNTMNDLLGLTRLGFLSLSSNSISDLSQVPSGSGLKQLTSLVLAGNQIRDPSPLSALTSLCLLDLSGNQIHRLGPQFDTRAGFLKLANNGLSQIAWPPGLIFETLDLSNNALTDLGGLSGVHFVNGTCERCGIVPGALSLVNNQITEPTPLLAATIDSSFGIDLSGNSGIVCAAQAPNIQALRARGVTLITACP